MTNHDDLEKRLSDLADAVIAETTAHGVIREGVVMTIGPIPYRRLDCDGRALAYVKTRPKKQAVRIDVSGLWAAPPKSSPLRIRSSSGAALLVQTIEDVREAVRFLSETVERTRQSRAGKAWTAMLDPEPGLET